MNRDEAEAHILREFDGWVKRTCAPGKLPSGTEAMVFFAFLELERPHVLAFKAQGDKWQIVHAVLLHHHRVAD